MKHFITLFTFTMCQTAIASEITPINYITAISYNETTDELSFSYEIGGGCEDHTTEIKFELQNVRINVDMFTAFSADAIMKIDDVTARYDGCERILTMNHQITLKDLLKKAIKGYSNANDATSKINVVLPKLQIKPNSPF